MCKCKVTNICEIALNCVNSTLECLQIYILEYAAYLSLWWGGDLLLRAGDFLLRLSSRSRCSNLDVCDERHAKCSTIVEFDSCASQFIFILLNSMPGVHALLFDCCLTATYAELIYSRNIFPFYSQQKITKMHSSRMRTDRCSGHH